MKSVWLKRLAGLLVLVAIAAGVWYGLRERPDLVDVATVSSGPMKVTIREEGVTRVRNVYTISAPIAGNLTRTLLEEGDPVEKNKTVVASIEPLEPPLIDRRTEAELLAARDAAKTGVGIARIDLQKAETALRITRDDLARAERLYGPGVISETTLQNARNAVETAQAQVDAARETIKLREAELASAEARLMTPGRPEDDIMGCCVSLVAPTDGVVLAVYAKSEQAVQAGAKIADVGDPHKLEVVVDLLSADAVRIRPGTRAVITDWGGSESLGATVRRVDPAAFTKVSALGIEEQRVNAILDLDEDDPRLGHGYRVFAEMTVWECETCLHLPIGALFRSGQDWNVFVVDGDRLKTRAVEIGHMNDETAEVLGGVSEGEVVVTHPSDTLEEGSLVEAR